MADDITLTVRVRDMTRRPLAELSQRLRRVERDLHARSSQSNMFDRAGQSIQRFQNRLGTASAFVGRFRRGLNSVTSSAVNPLRRAMDGLGNATRTAFRVGERSVAGLRNGLRSAYGPLTRLTAGFWRLGRVMNNMLNTNQRWKAIILATLILVGAAAQALGALLVTVLGGAFIALGAFALRGSSQVKAAFREMRSAASSVLTEAAQPMEKFLVGGMQQVTAAVKQMQPALTAAFGAAGPLISDFFGAFTNFGASALPGFVSTLRASQPTMAGFNNAMSQMGKGLGDMFAAMTANGGAEALRDVWITLGREMANLLVGIGEFVNTAAKSGTATMLLVGVFRAFSGVLNLVTAGLAAVDFVFGGLFQHINDNVIGMDKLTGGVEGLGASFVAAGQDVGLLKKQLAETEKEIARIKKVREDSLVEGPAKDHAVGKGNSEADLKKQQERRKALLAAIAGAEEGAAKATRSHAQAIQELINKVRELNDLNRSSLDARAAQEKAIDDASSKYKEFANALKMVNGSIAGSLTEQGGRDAYELLSKIASSTNDATKAAQDAHAPWSQVQSIWTTGRENLIRLADGMGLTKEQARILADQILKMPNADVTFRANTQEAVSSLQSFIAAVERAPGSKSVTLKTLSAHAEQVLTNFGYKVRRLPDGSVTVTAATGTAATNIEYIRNILAGLDGTTARTYVETINTTIYQPDNNGKSLHEVVGGATGGSAASLRKARPGFAGGGSISGGVLGGPGTKTSDSLVARLSRGEFVMRAAAVDKYGVGFMQRVNNGLVKLPGFAKGGMSQSTKDARRDLSQSFSISHFGKIGGYKRDPFEKALSGPDSLSSLISSLNQNLTLIRKASSGSTERRLTGQLTHTGKYLLQHQRNLDKVNKALDKAKDKLNDLRQAAASLKESVTSGVMSGTNITKAATSGDKNLTVADLMTTMTQGRDKATAFAGALKGLRGKGVAKEIIQQVAEAGIDGGGLETAGALLGASSSEISSLNAMQGQINASAKSAGQTASDAMYAAGLKAADGLVKGLTKKKSAIEKAMLNIAKAMETAIKKALKIKSPSRVMEEVGHYTAEGFAVGMQKNQSTDSAWTSMLHAPSGASGGSAGGGARVIQLVVSGRVLDEIILDSNQRTVRTRGGNVQAVYGKR